MRGKYHSFDVNIDARGVVNAIDNLYELLMYFPVRKALFLELLPIYKTLLKSVSEFSPLELERLYSLKPLEKE